MDLLWILTVSCVFAQSFCYDDEIDITKLTFSEDTSKEILRMQWSVFGKSDSQASPNIYRNTVSQAVLETPMGTVKGILTESTKRNVPYGAFFGMPYAKPPIDNLRFAAPLPAEPWSGVYDGTYERHSCLQFESSTNYESEDCLYINVYTPNYHLKSKPLAVMVFIYGGAFIGGSSNSSIYSPDFLIENDVVLVTFNYRLGVLGFLSLQNEAVPGNAGLKDQALALQWVQKNIASFGGDPDRVTIFGESAGAASVHYHVLSPTSKGLFHGAIMESGVTTAPWAFVPNTDVLRLAKAVAGKVGCKRECLDEMLRCLRQVPAKKLTAQQQGALTLQDVLRLRPFAFVPTQEPNVGGAFLSEPPIKILMEGRFNPVPSIIGSNSREALITLPVLKKLDPLGIGIFLVGFDLSLFYPYQLREKKSHWERWKIHNEIKKFYFGDKFVTIHSRDKMINLITDSTFTMPIQQAAALLSNSTGPVYNYIFSFNGEYGFYKNKLDLKDEDGVCHGDELGYLFYNEGLHPSYSNHYNASQHEDSERVVDELTTMWTNFAKTGNPTPKTDQLIITKWLPRSLHDLKYMDIGESMKLISEDETGLKGRLNFWHDLTK